MALQMAQKGSLWPSVMIALEPVWRKVKLNWANIANVSITIRWKMSICYTLYGAIETVLAQLLLELSQFGAS